tara:strand:+ start:496 stop:618 length:123 start_codon:yes stop_codon:yes gene_type:complete
VANYIKMSEKFVAIVVIITTILVMIGIFIDMRNEKNNEDS